MEDPRLVDEYIRQHIYMCHTITINTADNRRGKAGNKGGARGEEEIQETFSVAIGTINCEKH